MTRIDLSIVSGTYNRLPSLQKMVRSVHESIKYNLSYEIVLVDGGSTDGTQNWCRQQPNIRLIEHGELKGAIKAFNDGAYAATGDFVVLGNDDIEYVGETLWNAWLYMCEHLECGIGCFYQDRNGKDWHVETMPVVRDGKQSHAYYGQVCIIPKWLGDYVGWWMNEEDFTSRKLKPLRTYGGDNEITAKIYEMGYLVNPISDCKIHDNELDDQLRKINNISGAKDPQAIQGHHPDSWSWGKRWTHPNGLCGPIIRGKPIMENRVPKRQRIIYLPIYEVGWTIQKNQKRGLREALQKEHFIHEYDYVGRAHEIGNEKMLSELKQICFDIHPTLIVSQIHNASQFTHVNVDDLKRHLVSVTWVNWNGDFWPENLLGDDNIKLSKSFDYQLLVNRQVIDQYRQKGLNNTHYWQIGWEPDGVGHKPEFFHDVTYLANNYGGKRNDFVKWLRSLNFTFGLYGNGWPEGWSKGQTTYNFIETCKVLRGCKITIGDSHWPDSGFVSNRLFQSLVAGNCLVAYQYFKDYEKLGLIDGANCCIWYKRSDLEEKIKFYLENESERIAIAEAGQKLAFEQHSFNKRVQELFSLIGLDIEEKIEFEDWR